MNDKLLKHEYKRESLVILCCIVCILSFYILYKFVNYIAISELDTFASRSSSNNGKRQTMIQIFKSNDVNDPDEKQKQCGDYDENINDPDSTCGYDPDSIH